MASAIPLVCGYQPYEWGKPGNTSRVADLVGERDPAKRYAELWIGTHPSKPATIKADPATTLKSLLETNAALLGESHVATFGPDMPFLLKVLSIDKALSIQAHPEKAHAEKLHTADPKNYPDANHKPELVVALTPFQALCCFRSIDEIKGFVALIPELASLLPTSKAGLLACPSTATQPREPLRAALAELYGANPSAVGDAIDARAATLKLVRAEDLGLADRVFLRVQSEFPRDVGCWMVYFLNVVNMAPGDGLFMAPNEPHSYLQGDCVEIMASSDNVVRAGLTPKFKDVTVLLDMLTYKTDSLHGVSYSLDGSAPVQTYAPPQWCNEFSLTAVRLGGAAKHTRVGLPSAGLGVVVSGAVMLNGTALSKGATFAVPAASGLDVTLADGATEASIYLGTTRSGGAAKSHF